MKIYFNRKLIKISLFILLVSCLYTLTLSLFPICIQQLVDSFVLDYNKIFAFVFLYVLLRLAHTVLGYLDMYLSWIFEKDFKSNLMNHLVYCLFKRHRTLFHDLSVSEYLAIFNNNVDEIESYFELYLILIRYICAFTIYFYFLNQYIGFVFSIIIVVALFLGSLINRKIIPFTSKLNSKAFSALGKYLTKTRNLLVGSNSFPTESKANISYYHKKLIENEESEKIKALNFKAFTQSFFVGYQYILKILVVFLIIILIYFGEITAGKGIATYQFFNYLSNLIGSILITWADIGFKKGSFSLVDRLNAESKLCKPSIHRFQRISINKGQSNILIEKSKKYLFVGENGSGKSTILKEIAQITACACGIQVDDKELKDLDMSDGVLYLDDKPIIFSDTFLNNVSLYSGEYPNKEFLGESLFNKFKRLENTTNCSVLSGGEKQLVNFFRAFNLSHEILILDEAFSALDTATFHDIFKYLTDCKKTIILVAHQALLHEFKSNDWNIVEIKNSERSG